MSLDSAIPVPLDVGEAEFEREVIERSRAVLVIVDFWAEWCAPCRALGPLLEAEVAALGGKALLVKVDTDRAPALSTRFQIRSIPAVKAFRDGRVVDEFVGALPASGVRAFLARLVPSTAALALDRAAGLLVAGDRLEAESTACTVAFDDTIDRDLRSRAAVLLAKIRIERGAFTEALAALDRVDGRSSAIDRADQTRAFIELLAEGSGEGTPETREATAREAIASDEKNHEARFRLAALLAARGDFAGSLEQLAEVVARSRRFRDDGARRAMLVIFDWLGADHDLVRDFRHRLQVIT